MRASAKIAVQLPMIATGLGAAESAAEKEAQLNNLMLQIGQQPYTGGQGAVGKTLTPPPQAGFAVAGSGGTFNVTITNPTGLPPGAVPIHEVQSSLNPRFDSPTSYGQSPQTSLAAAHAAQWRYFRIRSKYPNSSYNNWITSGPYYSG